MDIKYERIVEVNKGVTYTNVKGKNYAEVGQRVQAFRNLIPGGYITTEIIRHDPGVVYMKAECGYYENGQKVMLSTGMAFERQDASNVNKTSYIENCETSAIGRALGFMGIGSESSICSVEELKNAIETQNAIAQGKIPEDVKQDAPKSNPKQIKQDAPANVTQSATLPKNEPADPSIEVLDFLAHEREELRKVREITKAENVALWNAQIAELKKAGLCPNKPLKEFTKDEAVDLVACMYANFDPTSAVLKNVG